MASSMHDSPLRVGYSHLFTKASRPVCQALYDGESYELCLTTAHTAKQQVSALSLYQTLRRINPAPYAAWLAFSDELQVISGEARKCSLAAQCD